MLYFQQDLTMQERFILMEKLARKEKKTFLAYLIWYFLGIFGAHRFYARKTKTGIVMLAISVISIALFIASLVVSYLHLPEDYQKNLLATTSLLIAERVICIITLSAGSSVSYDTHHIIFFISLILWTISFILWIIDIFLVHGIVHKYNKELEYNIVQEIKENRKKNE